MPRDSRPAVRGMDPAVVHRRRARQGRGRAPRHAEQLGTLRRRRSDRHRKLPHCGSRRRRRRARAHREAVLARPADRAPDARRLSRRAVTHVQLRRRRRRAGRRPRWRRVPSVRRLRRDGLASVDPTRRLRSRRRRSRSLQRLLGRPGHRRDRRPPARRAPHRTAGIVGRAVVLDVARHFGCRASRTGVSDRTGGARRNRGGAASRHR